MTTQKEAPAVTEANTLKQYGNYTPKPQVDKEQITRFVNALFRYADDGYVALRAFKDDNKPVTGCTVWKQVTNKSDLIQAAYAGAGIAARTPGAVYCPPIATFKDNSSAGESNYCLGLALSVDIDTGKPAQEVQKLTSLLRVPPTVVVESGGLLSDEETGEVLPKLHAHWRLDEPTSTPEEHAKLKKLRILCTAYVSGDATNNPICHPIRWPGTIHQKGEPKLCCISEINPESEISLNEALEIMRAAVPQSISENAAESTKGKKNDPAIYIQCEDDIRSGLNFHQSLVRLSAKYSCDGMGERPVRERLTALMEASESPRDERWQQRVNSIPNIVRTAHAKFFNEHFDLSAVDAMFEKLELSKPENGWLIVPFGLDSDPDLSHDTLALDLSKAGFTKDARYVSSIGKWYFWSGYHWRADDRLLHMTAIRDFIRVKAQKLVEWAEKKSASLPSAADVDKLMKWAKDNAKALKQAGSVTAVENVARSNADLVATIEQFDADLMKLGTPNGTVDLTTGELIEPQRGHWITKLTAVSPAERSVKPELWLKFLDRIFDGNQEIIDFMQRAAGYALTGRTDEHKLLFLFGTGSNGKSVFLNTIYGIMGDYAKRAAAQTFLNSHGDRHPTDLAGLMGARLVAGSELPAGKAWNESVIKDLTGGDVITARFMRQDFFDFMPQFTLFIAGNHRPSFSGIDEAIRRRVCLVPFTQTIPAEERDPELPEKLKAEWPAILRWMIEGAELWQLYGLAPPDDVNAASAEYMEDEDTLADFFDENVNAVQFGYVTVADMYERFCKWQRINGAPFTWSRKAMSNAFAERGIKSTKGTGGVRKYDSYTLKVEPAHYRSAHKEFEKH